MRSQSRQVRKQTVQGLINARVIGKVPHSTGASPLAPSWRFRSLASTRRRGTTPQRLAAAMEVLSRRVPLIHREVLHEANSQLHRFMPIANGTFNSSERSAEQQPTPSRTRGSAARRGKIREIKLLPVYSSQTADAKILIPSTLRYLRARSADIPQPKSRTVRTFCAAPHTRYDEPRLWHRKGVGLLRAEPRCGRSATSQAASSAESKSPTKGHTHVI